MPLPKPANNEEREDFIERCMSDDVMQDEYEDIDQRLAVCNSQWREEKMLRKLYNPIESCDLKLDSAKTGEFEGYASVFGGVDAYGDTIMKGAYKKTLKSKRNPSMFVNHDSFQVPVGDWIELAEDDTGLIVRGRIDMNHKDGPTVYSALNRGAMDGLSIGFKVPKGGSTENETGGYDLTEITLKEISVVNFPADDAARIAIVKHDIEVIESLKDAEILLRDSGYSKSAATAFVSRVKELSRRDAGNDSSDEITKQLTGHLVDFINRIEVKNHG